MVGAKPMIKPIAPIAPPRFSRGMISRMTLKTMGMTKPVAQACKTRPKSSNPNTGETADMMLPTAKMLMPPKNSLRVSNLPMRNAASGITTASVSE